MTDDKRESVLAKVAELKGKYAQQIRSLVLLSRTLDGQVHTTTEDQDCTHRAFVCQDCGQTVTRAGNKQRRQYR